MTLHPDAQRFLDVIAETGAPPLTSMTPALAAQASV
jgi:hypothetical protein